MFSPRDPTTNPQISRPHLPIACSIAPCHHRHTPSSPELRPRVDNAWALRVRPNPQQRPSDCPQTGSVLGSSHFIMRPRADQDGVTQRRSSFATRVNTHFVPGIRGRSGSDAFIAHTSSPDLDPDRLARACGQPALTGVFQRDDRSRRGNPDHMQSTPLKDLDTLQNGYTFPPLPKARVAHMYRRLDALARRSGHRVMDYLGFEDMAVIHNRDNQLREQLRRKCSERLQEKDPSFHAIGAPLEDVLLYASTTIVIGNYEYYLPIVVVSCIEELTKTGIYQSGLFRTLPSRDRHLQLIDLFDKSPDFGAQFNMQGQSMPDICALLSTFISSLPTPLLDAQIYAALWYWSVKPSVKSEDAHRDRLEEEEEDRPTRGEPPNLNTWMMDIYFDEADSTLETDQISITQILLRFIPSPNLSLLAYLCGFFTQLPLCPENGLQLEDVARIFAHRLLGGSIKAASQRMMLWLLTRWHRISDTLFEDTCGLSPPLFLTGEGNNERVEKRKGKRECGSDDALHHFAPTSSSHSCPSTESLKEHGMSRKSSSKGEEGGRGGRRRKKRELDTKEPHANMREGPSTRKESKGRRGHGNRRRHGSKPHRHRGHSLEQSKAPTLPDPLTIASAKVQQDLVDDAPLLTTPSTSALSRGEPIPSNHQRLDTPVCIDRSRNDSRLNNLDIQEFLRETAVATDVERALADGVEVSERASQKRQAEESQVERPIIQHPLDSDGGEGKSEGDGKGDSD